MRATVVSAANGDGGRGAGNEAELGDGEACGLECAGIEFSQADDPQAVVLPKQTARDWACAKSGFVDDEVLTGRQVRVEHFHRPAAGTERVELALRQRQDERGAEVPVHGQGLGDSRVPRGLVDVESDQIGCRDEAEHQQEKGSDSCHRRLPCPEHRGPGDVADSEDYCRESAHGTIYRATSESKGHDQELQALLQPANWRLFTRAARPLAASGQSPGSSFQLGKSGFFQIVDDSASCRPERNRGVSSERPV